MSEKNEFVYIGYSEATSPKIDEPELLSESISDDFDECLFKTAWALEASGHISENDAEYMDVDLADALGIHILGINKAIVSEMAKI